MLRWPARSHWRWRVGPAAVGAIAVVAAALALAPLVGLVFVALGDTGELWLHLARYVIPVATGADRAAAGGRRRGDDRARRRHRLGGHHLRVSRAATRSTWLLPLPLAIPTYIVAYVYVDILDALGPVQSVLRAIFGWRSAADYWFPEVRSLGGADPS